ncbi:hypothetical protein Pcinc_021635 [Petrolisthes cinctipes]|uniref:RNA methyltransferase n=1 Tax=Petrolisthes cinctipes TaxID=88211 RepID=A0AAE1FHL1_PETCI|nr:hypothetical protein Pcinc_021635 [Petrolisthes cinctipes]
MSSELSVERPTSLALSDPPAERRVHFSEVEAHSRTHSTPSPRKPRPDPDFRPKRKRSLSFSGSGGEYRGNKRRKRGRVLPSKFLLGGSITDPLNLGSLDDEEEVPPSGDDVGGTGGGGGSSTGGTGGNRRWAAVRVIIPPNINDPLNLDASSDNEDLLTDAYNRSNRRRRRSRKRKRRLSEPGDLTGSLSLETTTRFKEAEDSKDTIPTALFTRQPQNSLKPLTVNTELMSLSGPPEVRRESVGPVTPTGIKLSGAGGSGVAPRVGVFKKQRSKSDNKIVSPVIPQPGGERKRHPSHNRHFADKPHLSQQNLQPPATFNPKNEVFQYGNYNKYYGYRNPACTPDPRLQYLKRDWFEGREVLDVGCNIGHVALTIARDYSPKRVVGIDIDKKLINIANKNIKHYLRKGDPEEAAFPSSMRLLYGPLKTPVRADGTRAFPYNVKFLHANYVLESDELLETVRPEFDMILCLSITKWIHLNWGDSGLKRFFRRCFYNLKPGGRLIMEPQAWPSYNKRRKLTKRIFDNYKSIRLFPDKFNDYLLHDVGFSTSEKMGTPHHAARGFQRPIIVYTKAAGSSKCSPSGESGAREAGTCQGIEKCQQIQIKNKEYNSNSSITSRVDQGVCDNSNGVIRSADTLKQTKSPQSSHNELEDRIASQNTPEREETVHANKQKNSSKFAIQEMHKITEIEDILSNQGTPAMENCKNACSFAKEVTNICDNKIIGNLSDKTVIELHSLPTDTHNTDSSQGSQHVSSELVDLQPPGTKICTSCSKDTNVPSNKSLDAGMSSEIKDSRTVSTVVKCNCNGNLARKQFDNSNSTARDRTSRKEMSSDKSSGESCQNMKIQSPECLADGSDLPKESVRICEASSIPKVVSADKNTQGIEEINTDLVSGFRLKRRHCDKDDVEGKEVYANEPSKKLRLEDT